MEAALANLKCNRPAGSKPSTARTPRWYSRPPTGSPAAPPTRKTSSDRVHPPREPRTPPDFSTGSRAYLRRAATNAALDIVQSRYVRSGVSLEVSGDEVERDPGPAPDRQHLGRELHQHLRKALTKLSRRGAEIFVLRYFEGLDNNEIAEHLGTTTNTVAVTLHRARARLKEEMGPFMGGLQ